MDTQKQQSNTLYARMVNQAMLEREKEGKYQIALESATSRLTQDHSPTAIINIIASALNTVNEHITVDDGLISSAEDDYKTIGEHLIDNLKWGEDDIKIKPQGSCSTRTLIRSPKNDKFDIDAVCRVEINRSEIWDPIAFFEQFDEPLRKWKVEKKNRCWKIEGLSPRYYIEFTPSVPLQIIPQHLLQGMQLNSSSRYHSTALAVVDRETKQWKTSNPEGLTKWVDDQSQRHLLRSPLTYTTEARAYDSVEPIQSQNVPLGDTLRVAIRLFKRHRDMAVARGQIHDDDKPISIIIVTLLTQCYEGMADQGMTYDNPVELLKDLAELMLHMPQKQNGSWWIENPTVTNENFAEKWKTHPERAEAFRGWCELLNEHLEAILTANDRTSISVAIEAAFGVTRGSAPPPGNRQGVASSTPSRPLKPAAGTGLA